MGIYTKKGDDGKTGLIGTKERFYKDDLVYQAIGSIDELVANLGLIIAKTETPLIIKNLLGIQEDLMLSNAILAGAEQVFGKHKVRKLERFIDTIETKLPKLSNFILPGGAELSSYVQIARSVTRRAERNVVSLNKIYKVNPEIIAYINRLSDYLFMLARDINFRKGIADVIWKK